MTTCSTPDRTDHTSRTSHASRNVLRLGAITTAAGLISLGLAAPASAHVSVTASESGAGAYTVLTFSVPHGCDGSPTTKVAISVPEGINAVTPTRNAFYTVAKKSEQLDPPVQDAHGNEVTERISVVTYTATTPLQDGFRDTLELSLQLPDAEGETLSFPVVQTCAKGETAWTEVAAEGEGGDELTYPAPQVSITGAAAGGHHDDAAEAGDDDTEHGDPEHDDAEHGDDDSSNGLAIAGLVAGVLGLLAGGAALARGRKA